MFLIIEAENEIFVLCFTGGGFSLPAVKPASPCLKELLTKLKEFPWSEYQRRVYPLIV